MNLRRLNEAVKGEKIGHFLDSLSKIDKAVFLNYLNKIYQKIDSNRNKTLLISDLNDDIFYKDNNGNILIPSRIAIDINIAHNYKFWFNVNKEPMFRFLTYGNERTDSNAFIATPTATRQYDRDIRSKRDIVSYTSYALIIKANVLQNITSYDKETFSKRKELSKRLDNDEIRNSNIKRYEDTIIKSGMNPGDDKELVVAFKKIIKNAITINSYYSIITSGKLSINNSSNLKYCIDKLTTIATFKSKVLDDNYIVDKNLDDVYSTLVAYNSNLRNKRKIDINDFDSKANTISRMIEIIDSSRYIELQRQIENTYNKDEIKNFNNNILYIKTFIDESEKMKDFLLNTIETVELDDFNDCLYFYDNLTTQINRLNILPYSYTDYFIRELEGIRNIYGLIKPMTHSLKPALNNFYTNIDRLVKSLKN